MKNKRLTILFVMITLAGSPQVWRQLGNLIDAVQHQAQVKFLSLVLSPQDSSDEVETTPSAQVEHLASSCPASAFEQAPVDSQVRTDSPLRQIKTERRAASKPEAHGALALKDTAQDQGASSLHEAKLARVEQNRLTLHSMNSLPTDLAMEKSDIDEMVVVPRIDSFVPVNIDSVNLSNLKKTLEENKAPRQKIRYLIGRPVMPVMVLPAPKAEAISSEREG